PVVASYWMFYFARPSGGEAAYGTLIQPTVSLPDASAEDLRGQVVPLRSLKGQWLIVVVGPATCDAACERRLFLQRQLREVLGRDRDRVDKVWLITDAGPLKPSLQHALAEAPAATVLRVAAPVLQGWLKPAANHALEDHLYLVDPMGEWMMRMPVEPDPAKVKRDLDRLLR